MLHRTVSSNQDKQSHITEKVEEQNVVSCNATSNCILQSGQPVPHNREGGAAKDAGEGKDQSPGHQAGLGAKGKPVEVCRLL